MKKIYLFSAVCISLMLAISCGRDDVRIGGKFVGLSAKKVYLEKMSASGKSLVDSVELSPNGEYRFRLERADATPTLYNLIYNGDRIPLLITKGERIEVSAIGNALANYTVAGSKESELLREFNREYLTGQVELRAILAAYPTTPNEGRSSITEQYNMRYRDIKRKQISFIIEHKGSVAAVYALYQRLSGEQYLSSADSDIIYYRTVADALAKIYPTSPFLVTLQNDIARMEARISLLNSIELRTYPNLKGVDMYGNEVPLSSLEGNVILVDFWSAELGNSNAFNAELKQLYHDYYDKGFRVYQVSADRSKAHWIRVVQEQRLPWISVCDFMAERSPMLHAYNVTKLPSNYLIDRKGNIVGKDLYSDALAEKVRQLLD